MKKLLNCPLSILLILLFFTPPLAAQVEKKDQFIFIGADVGYAYQNTDVDTELNKHGVHSDIKILYSKYFQYIVFDLGAGFSFNYIEGESDSGLVRSEDIKTNAAFLEFGSRFLFPNSGFELGALTHLLLGADVGFNATGDEKHFTAFLGPQLTYFWNNSWAPIRLNMSFLTDLNINNRQNYMGLVGVQFPLWWNKGLRTAQPKRKSQKSIVVRRIDAEPKPENRYSLDSSKVLEFDFGSAAIAERSKPRLNRFAKGLKKMKSSDWELLTIEGHADSVGDNDLNLRLSQERANTVRAYLIERGVEASKLKAKGFGETKPLVSDPKSRLNRRVEFAFQGVKDKPRFDSLMDEFQTP